MAGVALALARPSRASSRLLILLALLVYAEVCAGLRTIDSGTGPLEMPADVVDVQANARGWEDGAMVADNSSMHLPYNLSYNQTSVQRYFELPLPTGTVSQILQAIGGGTGAHMGTWQNKQYEQEMIVRMRYQDRAIVFMIFVAYIACLFFSASIAYRQAHNSSPVTYYADPRCHDMSIDSDVAYDFLRTFDQPPKDLHLQVSGYSLENVAWAGSRYRLAFSFALDISSWIVRDGGQPSVAENTAGQGSPCRGVAQAATGGSASAHTADIICDRPEQNSATTQGQASAFSEDEAVAWRTHVRSLSDAGFEELREYISDGNDLAVFEIKKEVEWRDWEDLAMNIKLKIRQSGFPGKVIVRRSCHEDIRVYKNQHWANFMHSRMTKVLCALSVVGWILYHPYMWLRTRARSIRSRYRVEIPIGRFWAMVEDQMNDHGFLNS